MNVVPLSLRRAGLLLHPTALPGGHGSGDLGSEAFAFIERLHAAGLGVWQVLPLGPPGYGDSPYAAQSAFAGNLALIALDPLATAGLLTAEELADAPVGEPGRVSPQAAAFKRDRLQRAYRRWRERGDDAALAVFRAEHAGWLDDFALFLALHDRHAAAWTDWPAPLARREPAALAEARSELAEGVAFHEWAQWRFWEQWATLRTAAGERGIALVGDMPIFVAHDSADVWANQDLFLLDASGQPTEVAGVPPDYFSPAGQRWGNPLYRWEALDASGFQWWIDRFRHAAQLFDLIRIDHFRGFEAAWQIPASETTAINGRWTPAPGDDLFRAVQNALGRLPLLAEDLGVITPAVERLRDDWGLPGMRVLQFGFGGDATSIHLPHNFAANSVVYTGTHDNDTTVGWYTSAPAPVQDHLRRYLAVDGNAVAWDLLRAAFASVAELTIVPVQDVLALGGEGRMNLPGRPDGNWSWRLTAGAFTEEHAARLRELATLYGRLAQPAEADDTREATP